MGALHVVMRSSGGENRKARPEWYSKDLCLASVLVAAANAQADLTFVNDGELPAHRVAVMKAAGTVVPVSCGANRPSLRATVAWVADQPWRDADLVYLLEDDYLLDPDALQALRAGAEALPWADWFTLHGESAYGDPTLASTLPAARVVGEGLTGAAEGWSEVVSTTSSLAGRMKALRRDRGLLRWAPFVGGAFDEVTTLAMAGHEPFTWGDVAANRGVPGLDTTGESLPQATARRLARTWVNLRSHRLPRNRRRFAGARPPLAAHLETDALADPRWEAIARATPPLEEAARLRRGVDHAEG